MGKIYLDTTNLTEPQLKQLLVDRLSPDFEIKPEVGGVHVFTQEQVKIDFLMKAKPHVIESGFISEWFGIEVKNLCSKKKGNKVNKLFWQALTYTQSEFDGKRLPFVLVYVNTDFFKSGDEFYRSYNTVATFCLYGNVGSLVIEKQGYTIRFGAHKYYQKRAGEIFLSKYKDGLIRKRVGHIR